MTILLYGRCACGASSFTCAKAPLAMYNCHCHGCQKMGGAPYSPLLVFQALDVRLAGQHEIFKSRVGDDPHSRRAFCPICRAVLFACSDTAPEILLINALALDEPAIFSPVADIWTAHVLPWTPLDLRIPKVLKSPPVLGEYFV